LRADDRQRAHTERGIRNVNVDVPGKQVRVDYDESQVSVDRMKDLDEGRFDELRSLLVEHATLRSPGAGVEGIEAIVAQAARIHVPDDGVLHAITNLSIDIAGDTATARANLMVSFATPLATDEHGQPPMVHSIQGRSTTSGPAQL